MTIFGKPPLSFISTLASALALLVPGVAFASNFNSPLYGCDYGTYSKCYISAYYDIAKGDKDVAANGKDWNCGSKAYSGHNGTDFGIGGNSYIGSRGTIVAAADGVVDYTNDGCATISPGAGNDCGGGYGNYVKITHSDSDRITIYAHMQNGSVAVKSGQSVKCGDKLGMVGSSGSSTGAHLHFDVRPASAPAGANRFDPFHGSCNTRASEWKKQNGWKQLPADDQCTPVPINDAAFASETIPDDSEFTTGQSFTKTWTLKNTGNTTWTKADGYRFASIGGTQMSSVTSVELGSSESIAPGATKTWSVPMTAPSTPGTYTHNWSMQQNGTNFGGVRFTRIKAVAPVVPDVNDASLANENTPAGTQIVGGSGFTKTWTVKNTGNTTWTKAKGYRLAHVSGSPFSASVPVALADGETIAPGATKTWSVAMTAPISVKTHWGAFQMEQSGVGTFGPTLEVSIDVIEEAPEDDPVADDPVIAPDASVTPEDDAQIGDLPDDPIVDDETDAGVFGEDDPSTPDNPTDGQNATANPEVFISILSTGCSQSAASPLPWAAILLGLALLPRRRNKTR